MAYVSVVFNCIFAADRQQLAMSYAANMVGHLSPTSVVMGLHFIAEWTPIRQWRFFTRSSWRSGRKKRGADGMEEGYLIKLPKGRS